MSLPDAQKVVSENPPKNSVASPVDKTQQEQDVDRKLRFYGIIQAFRNGRMPDNAQIDEMLTYTINHSPINTGKLSPDGQKLVRDTQNIIETARRFVKEKNADEVVQQFFYHTTGASVNKPDVDVPVSEKEARKDAQEALEHLRTLFQLLITNSESRKLLSDFKLVGRGIFADAASNVAERARPAQEELDQVDNAAPTHHFEDSPERKDISVNGLKSTAAETAGVSPAAVKETQIDQPPVGDAATTAVKEGDTTTAKKTFRSRFSALTGRVPDKHKDRAQAELDNTKQYLKEQFPPERRDQIVYRLKKVVVECQSHPSYQKSLSWFLSQLEAYFGHGRRVASAGANQTNSLFSDPNLNQATSEMRTFLERCANGQRMDGMIDAAQRLWDDAQEDEELRAWWGRVDTFVRKSLLEPGFILAPLFESQARQLRDESRRFFDEKYKGHRDALVDAVESWFKAWSDDRLNKTLTDEWSKLIKDLLFDDSRNLTYKPHLWSDIRQVILPELVDKIGYVPIPRIEYTDNELDLVLENLTLQGQNIFPKVLELNTQNHIKVSPYKTIKDEHHHNLTLTLSQIQADMKDVAFYYRKKNGIKVSDSGLADVFLGGKGISVKIQISSTMEDRANGASLFKVKSVNVKVDALKFAIRDSKHNLLYKTLRPLATGLIKKQISKAIQDAVRTGLEYVDGQLVLVRDRMAAADESEDTSKTQVLKEYFHTKSSDTASKASSVKSKRNSQFRIVPQRDSMLLPNVGHEKGWSRKQYEREDAAADGDGWKSKAFSIVSPMSA
ncbi:hypothetical protein SCHPADRAFT_905341 [Schizopora paradoxa]|uniref:Uncharacterized protein n=1 Tax=Schizopora paradoxa TaxID=27342 RepID=A0A0H2RJN4_9AGAM|nr:hypothetical protein SCHPADRAFT_905341 [Schizopora paradoxa]